MHSWCGASAGTDEYESQRICSECAGTDYEEIQRNDRPSQANPDSAAEEGVNTSAPGPSSSLTERRREKIQALLKPEGSLQKRNRVRLSYRHKAEVVKLIKEGSSYSSICSQYGISLRSCKRLKKDADIIEEKGEGSAYHAQRKSARSSKFPKIEAHLLKFINAARQARLSVTRESIRMRALMLRDQELRTNKEGDATQAALKSFTASDRWISKFTKRHELKSVTLHGEARRVDLKAVKKKAEELCERLQPYDAENIYSMGETALLYKLMPKKSYGLPSDNNTVRGTKGMNAEDRVTMIICTNATGTHTLPIALIGSVQNPDAFGIRPCPLPYFQQRKAWNDSNTSQKWFREVFLREVRKRKSGKVALVLDNASSHDAKLVDAKGMVDIFYLPPNCTALKKPMDMGMIAIVKKKYKYSLLSTVFELLEERENLRQGCRHWQAGTRGLYEGHEPHVLDAAELIVAILETLDPIGIQKCWLKSNILPTAAREKLNTSLHQNARRGGQNDFKQELQVIVRNVTTLLMETKESRQFHRSKENDISDMAVLGNEDIERWLNLEESNDLRELHESEALDEVERLVREESCPEVQGENQVSAAPARNRAETDMEEPLLASEVAECFGRFQAYAASRSWVVAGAHLRKAKQALLHNIKSAD